MIDTISLVFIMLMKYLINAVLLFFPWNCFAPIIGAPTLSFAELLSAIIIMGAIKGYVP